MTNAAKLMNELVSSPINRVIGRRKLNEDDQLKVNAIRRSFVKDVAKYMEDKYHYDESWNEYEYDINSDFMYDALTYILNNRNKYKTQVAEIIN